MIVTSPLQCSIAKTLEAVCEDRGAEGKNLKDRIGDLRTKIVLPTELFDAMDHLRLLGNDSAHIEATTFDDIGQDEVVTGIELAKEVIKATYQYKGLLGKLKALQKPAGHQVAGLQSHQSLVSISPGR